jgi:hypothetical protein
LNAAIIGCTSELANVVYQVSDPSLAAAVARSCVDWGEADELPAPPPVMADWVLALDPHAVSANAMTAPTTIGVIPPRLLSRGFMMSCPLPVEVR